MRDNALLPNTLERNINVGASPRETVNKLVSQADMPTLSEWRAQTLRLTVFPTPGTAAGNRQEDWEKLLGRSPDEIQVKPPVSRTLVRGSWVEEPTLHGEMFLEANPLRIDWRLEARPKLDLPESDFPTIGEAAPSIQAFRDLMLRWLENSPQIWRIAFGAVLVLPVDSREHGYRTLLSYLPVHIDVTNSSDFLLQINRRRRSSVMEIDLNRLSKWSVASIETHAIQVTPEGAQQTRVGSAGTAAMLELDINTAPEFREPLPPDRLPDLFVELIDLGTEIAKKGIAREHGYVATQD